MVYYLIVCRSLTHAQRTASILERAGIGAHVMRLARHAATDGCSHAVKISQQRLALALTTLRRAESAPLRVYMTTASGGYKEVRL